MTDEKLTIKFAPGCFPDDMTQEEIDEISAELTKMVEEGTLFENSEPIDMERLELEDPEMYEQLMRLEEHEETFH